MKVKLTTAISLDLEKAEMTLITKALCGKLRPEEVGDASDLGLRILEGYRGDLEVKLRSAEHAIVKASEG